ncbi:hypothetical protein F4054_03470 [Candidatus Poribacteria bacterium]|nr:hypothetical protein [Candidatus Poribacteria bacterium]MYK21299.1 hypothetical protein [Candidatus Poribacteria bacterium]
MQNRNEELQRSEHSHKYAIHFDILPEISYLNQELTVLVADLLPIFHNFPQDVWISEKEVDEGLDFCRVVFSVSAESPDAIKTFGNWFQAIFREPSVAEVLERLVVHALEEPNAAEVMLTDWTRLAN